MSRELRNSIVTIQYADVHIFIGKLLDTEGNSSIDPFFIVIMRVVISCKIINCYPLFELTKRKMQGTSHPGC